MFLEYFYFTQSNQHEYTDSLKYGNNQSHFIIFDGKSEKQNFDLSSHLVVAFNCVYNLHCDLVTLKVTLTYFSRSLSSQILKTDFIILGGLNFHINNKKINQSVSVQTAQCLDL